MRSKHPTSQVLCTILTEKVRLISGKEATGSLSSSCTGYSTLHSLYFVSIPSPLVPAPTLQQFRPNIIKLTDQITLSLDIHPTYSFYLSVGIMANPLWQMPWYEKASPASYGCKNNHQVCLFDLQEDPKPKRNSITNHDTHLSPDSSGPVLPPALFDLCHC